MLIVDDSKLSRAMVRAFAAAHRPELAIVEAADGGEALRAAEGQSVKYMTIDFNMPGMNGIDLAAQLKAKHPEAHICLLTANVQAAIQERAEQLGIGFVPKPITEEKIARFLLH